MRLLINLSRAECERAKIGLKKAVYHSIMAQIEKCESSGEVHRFQLRISVLFVDTMEFYFDSQKGDSLEVWKERLL